MKINWYAISGCALQVFAVAVWFFWGYLVRENVSIKAAHDQGEFEGLTYCQQKMDHIMASMSELLIKQRRGADEAFKEIRDPDPQQ